jgi:dihydrofolate reductase/thymidylate synthase
MPRIDAAEYPVCWSSQLMNHEGTAFQYFTHRRHSLHVDGEAVVCPTGLGSWLLNAAEHPELQYLRIVRDIMETGTRKEDRTGTGIIGKFGFQTRWNLRDGTFPLLTTKRVFWRGVVEELLWFMRGDTNAARLRSQGVHIWDGNASRSYLDSIGLNDREEDDLGPVYGFQWRHFGARYTSMHDDYTGQGIDQLAHVISTIKSNPTDRRIIMTAWNVSRVFCHSTSLHFFSLAQMCVAACRSHKNGIATLPHVRLQLNPSYLFPTCPLFPGSANFGWTRNDKSFHAACTFLHAP